MRPIGEASIAVELALANGPGTTRQIACRTGWSIGVMRYTLNNMRRRARSPHVVVVSCAREVGVRRPVPVYALAAAGECRQRLNAGGSADGAALADMLASVWRGRHGAR